MANYNNSDDVRHYTNDYSTPKGYPHKEIDEKPLSASDITAIAETTVNQLLQRDDTRGYYDDRRRRRSRSRSRDRRSRDRRSRSRSRSRDRRRDRRSRSRERSRDHRRSRSRSRSPMPSKERAESGSTKTSTVSRLEKLKDPRIVTVKGLQTFHKESDIRRKLVDERMKFRDIRVIFNKASQTGTAFVEFYSEGEASRWVRYNKGMLKVQGEYLTMDLCKPISATKKDWTCALCGEKNHHARQSCYSCQSEKNEAQEKPRLRSKSPPSDASSGQPSNVLMLRGLSYQTLEDDVMRRMRRMADDPIKDVRLITDKYTNKSRGFCFIEFSSVEDGRKFYNKITSLDPPLEIHGRRVSISYQREPQQNNPSSQAAAGAIAAAQWSATPQNDNSDGTNGVTTSDSTASPTQEKMPQTVGSYVYDEKSGYYYDQNSGLYYDPKTKYYYNPTDQQYYYWNDETQKYDTVTGPNNVTATTTTTTTTSEKQTSESTAKASKSAKVMTAKKIQKDMERWAKAKNRQLAAKAPAKPDPEPAPAPQRLEPSGHSIALKIAQDYADPAFQQVASQPQQSIFPIQTPVAASKPITLTDDQINRKFEDLNAMACLLCKRKFPSVENLKRHQELSDLHKTSMAAERQRMALTATNTTDTSDYRDRAQERRTKYGTDGQPPSRGRGRPF